MGDGNDPRAEDEEGQFKITDRRKFTPEGNIRQEEQGQSAPSKQTPPKKEEPPRAREEETQQTAGQDSPETINFASFLLSLATTGMVHLGEIPEPTTGQKTENLEAARQMIDILTILKEKTAGNLAADESQLLENLLYELRMKFLSQSKAIKL